LKNLELLLTETSITEFTKHFTQVVTVVHGTVDATGEKRGQFKEVGRNLE